MNKNDNRNVKKQAYLLIKKNSQVNNYKMLAEM